MKRQLKPQMTAELRIIVEDRPEDVLQIPVQSVLPLVGQFFTYVFVDGRSERRNLLIGMQNDEFVEVLDGVVAGEKVIMNPRTHFSQEINETEQQLLAGVEKSPRMSPSGTPRMGRPGAGGPRAGSPGRPNSPRADGQRNRESGPPRESRNPDNRQPQRRYSG